MIAILLFSCAIASAHAVLDHAEPKVGATVDSSPEVVKVWFSGAIEPTSSGLEVADSTGQRVDKQDVHVDEKDASLLIVSVPPLAPGVYTVTWRAVSKDTHHTHGTFQFTIASKS
ncbi:MAG: copper resistance protein CopC [Phycisphaerae bacterium]|nr:copper resistance protein CopC [Phycisphaerae bacterium]